MIKSIADLYTLVDNQKTKKKLVVSAAQDEHVLEAVAEASKKNIIDPIFVGDKKQIESIINKKKLDIKNYKIIDETDTVLAAKKAVALIKEGEGDILMKGLVNSTNFLRPVMKRDTGLRIGETLSHMGLMELPNYHKLFLLTDGALNIAPDLNLKISIIKNAVYFMSKIGISKPKVAALAAFELVNPNMQATIDAAILAKMAQRGQIRNCIIEGPLSFDNAISKESAKLKGLDTDVAGDADILLSPNIEAANVLYKSINYFAGANPACIILGASVPIILTSRSDTMAVKLNSIALAASVEFNN